MHQNLLKCLLFVLSAEADLFFTNAVENIVVGDCRDDLTSLYIFMPQQRK